MGECKDMVGGYPQCTVYMCMKTLKINEFGQKTSFQKEKRGTQTKIHTSGVDSLFFPHESSKSHATVNAKSRAVWCDSPSMPRKYLR